MKIKNFPPLITFRITSRCNNNCKCCFGPKNVKEMNFTKLKKLFRIFWLGGAKAILLTGGEPLIREDFKKVIQELKKYDFKIFLDTNGDFFFKYKDLISKNVDVLGLPIDFVNPSYRNEKNLEIILKILNFYKNKKKRPIIRIGTVVTKDNFNYLNKIGIILKNYSVDIWKIYEFTPQAVNALKNKSSLELSQKEFNKATKNLKKEFSRYFKVVISKRTDRNAAYFFVNPDGNVFIPIDDLNICRQHKIGNIFDSDILDKWKKSVSKSNYINNIKLTFNYKI